MSIAVSFTGFLSVILALVIIDKVNKATKKNTIHDACVIYTTVWTKAPLLDRVNSDVIISHHIGQFDIGL